MKLTTCSLLLVVAWCLSFAPRAEAATDPTNAAGVTVAGLRGLAQFAHAGGAYAPVKMGTVLHAGDLVQTANGSALDLFFGKSSGTIRLLQSTTLELTAVAPTNIQLNLKGGSLVGRWKKQPPAAKFQIEVSTGIAGILEGDFRLDSRGYLVLLEGTALYVELHGEAEPLVHTLDSN